MTAPSREQVIDMSLRYAAATDPLLQLTYVSRRNSVASDDVVINMLITAGVRNFLAGVSGQLFASALHFAQTLEGSATVVESTFRRISRDSRHSHVTCLLRKRVEKRDFLRPMSWTRIQQEAWPLAAAAPVDAGLSFDDACRHLLMAQA